MMKHKTEKIKSMKFSHPKRDKERIFDEESYKYIKYDAVIIHLATILGSKVSHS